MKDRLQIDLNGLIIYSFFKSTFNCRIPFYAAAYLLKCGLTQQEIDAIRANLLEDVK